MWLGIKTSLGILAAGVLLLGMVAAFGQDAQTSATVRAKILGKVVPLVSDACPEVRFGDKISLDLYPGFDEEAIVTGIHKFSLTFGLLDEDGVNLRYSHGMQIGGFPSRMTATPIENGYFHIEIPIRRNMGAGTYRLIDAFGLAEVPPENRGLKLQMTRSPVDSRYCITVVGSKAPQAP